MRIHINRRTAATAPILLALGCIWKPGPEAAQQSGARPFTVEQLLGFPSSDNLVTSPAGSTIAWTFNERGVRNIYAADAPAFEARKVTTYTQDDGQELTQLSFSKDGKTIVY